MPQRARSPLPLAPLLLATTFLVTALAGSRPACAADPLSEANRLMQAGDLAGARVQLLQAVQNAPRNGDAHYRLALLDMRLGDAPAAEREADLARRSGYDAHAATALLLQAYLAEGKYRELLQDFPATGNAANVQTTILVARGLAQLSLGQTEAAGATLDEAHRLAPKEVEPLLAQERLALARNDGADAQRKIDEILAMDPNSLPALDQKAYLLTQRGDKPAALAVLNEVIAKHPEDTSARLQRAGVLLSNGQDAAAREDVDGVLATLPGSAQALFYRAVLLARAHDYRGADADLNRLAPVIGRFPGAYFVEAVVKQQLGQMEQAREAAARFAARNPSDQQAAALLASIDLQMHRPDLAVTTLDRFVNVGTADQGGAAGGLAAPGNASGPAGSPNQGQASSGQDHPGQDNPQQASPRIYELLGRAYADQGKMDQANAALRHAVASKGTAPDAALLNQLAMSYLTMGNPGKAASSLQQSLRTTPAQPDAEQVLALAALQSGNVPEAQAALDRLKAQHGSPEAMGNLAGLIDTARLDFPAARADFEGVLHAAPDSVAAHVNLAHLDELENKPDDVRTQLAAVLAKNPANAQVLPLLTAKLLAAGQFDQAVQVLKAAHTARPADQVIAAALADAEVRAGAPQQALDLTDGADGRAPSLGMVAARAEAELALHQEVAARQTYRDYVASNPHALPARLTLIRMMVAAGDFAGARSMVADGLNITPDSAQLLGAAAAVELKAGGLDAALARAKELAADPAHQPAALTLPGDIYLLNNHPAEAASAYEAALRQAPSTTLAVQHARALIAAGRSDQAADALKIWTADHPDDANALTLLSSMDIVANRLDEARPLLQHLVALHPTDATALNNLAWVEQQKGQPDARALAQRAYLLAPGPQTADTLGVILVAGGDASAGVPLLRVAHQQVPTDPGITYHLAAALAGTGQKASALQLLEPVASGTSPFAERAAAQKLLADLKHGS